MTEQDFGGAHNGGRGKTGAALGLVLLAAFATAGFAADGGWIQKAIDERPGQMVFVPAGDHETSATIRIQADGSGLWGPGRIIAMDPDQAIIEIVDASSVQVRDLILTRPEGKRETRKAAVSVLRGGEILLGNLRVLENQTSSSAIEARGCAGIQVRDCLIENYCRIDIDDRRRTDRHRDYANYGYAFTCIAGNGLMISASTGVSITGNRIVERRLLPTPEVQARYDLGKFVGKDAEKGRVVSQKTWDEEYVSNWNQSRAMGVTSPEESDFAQISGNYFENAGQGTDIHADHVILAHNIVNNSHIGMKAMHGSRNTLVLGNQYVKSDLWSVGLMPGTASHSAGPAGSDRPAANVDGYSIIAHNIVAEFGRGNAGWVWKSREDLAPFRFDGSPLPSNPPLRDVIISGNVIDDSEKNRSHEAGAEDAGKARYRSAVRVADHDGPPTGLRFSANLFDAGGGDAADVTRPGN